MVKVSFIKPFYTKLAQKRLRMVFAYQYLAIEKNGELYHFIPIEGKEIIYNCETQFYENADEVFVFQRGTRFIRLRIQELLRVEGVMEALEAIIEEAGFEAMAELEPKKKRKVHPLLKKQEGEEFIQTTRREMEDIMDVIEEMNRKNYINAEIEVALATGDKERFMMFSKQLENKKK